MQKLALPALGRAALSLLGSTALRNAALCGVGLVFAAGAAAWVIKKALQNYRIEDFDFESDGIVLRGSLYLPRRRGPLPGIVLVHGLFLGLRRFYRFYAEFFAGLGIAVLVWDRRGSGASEGGRALLDLQQQARDAAAAWFALREHHALDRQRIGFWGYSMGGAATLQAAEMVPDPAFIIGLSQPALPLGEMLLQHTTRLLRGKAREEALKLRKRLWAYTRSGRGWKKLYRDLSAAQKQPWYRLAGLPGELDPPADPQNEEARGERLASGAATAAELPFRWQNEDFNYDPLPALSRLDCPILLLYGERDMIVPSREFIRRVEALRGEQDLRGISIRSYSGGDHAMHYPWLPFNLRPFFCPGYLDDMADWLEEVTSARPRSKARRPKVEIVQADCS